MIKRIFKPADFFKDFLIGKKFPIHSQKKVLLKILNENKETEYGKKFQFSSIKSIKDFQKKLPIVNYPDIINYIEKMKRGDKNILVKNEVLYFATSSGTTSEPKFIPVTKKRMEFHRGEFLLWFRYMLKKNVKIVGGKTLYFAGGDLNGYTKGKLPYGNISGYLTRNSSQFIRKKLVVDMDVLNIMHFNRKMEKIAVLSLLEKNIAQIAFASAVQAILFFDYLAENKDKLISKVKRKDKKRALILMSLKEFKPIDIWPKLWLINCIKAGANSIYLEVVKEKLGKENVVIRDPGILASEGRVSLGITEIDGAGIIPINESFFEFMNKQGEKFSKPILIDKIKKGKQYKIIMTTSEGLYRYDLGDVVEVVGFMDKIPIVQFVSRNKFLNVTEEHAPEGEIVRGVINAMDNLGIKFRSFTVIPNVSSGKKPKYEIFLELLLKYSDSVMRKLMNKIDSNWQKYILTYSETRNEFGRMDPPILSLVKKGTYDKIDSNKLAEKGQAKPILVTEDFSYKKNFKILKSYS